MYNNFVNRKMERPARDAELENYLDALNDFVKKPSKKIPTSLEQLIQRIARHGEPLFPWFKLKPLIVMKLENVIEEYIEHNPHEEVPILPNVENVRFDDMRERLLRALESFNSAPFTIQRLCELLTEPKRYYRRSDKFMRGVEKNVQVVSTVTPSGKRITSLFDLQKSPPMMNGIVADTDSPPASDNNGFVRPDSDTFSTPSSSSSSSSGNSSSRVDSMNGVSRPFYSSDPMDAPLQFAYPLGQATVSLATSMPSSESNLRTDLSRVNGPESELHEADAKETSEAVPEAPRDPREVESRTSEERTGVSEECADVDTASVVSSSDVESFSGDGSRREDEEEDMDVDVASSEGTSSQGDGDAVDGDVTAQGHEKEGSGDVSTSATASSVSEEKPETVEEQGKADSSEDKGGQSSTPMECEESLSTNSEAAASRGGETKGPEETMGQDGSAGEVKDRSSSGPAAEAQQPECGEDATRVGAAPSCEVGPAGDAGPADSSNDAQASREESAADETASGTSEADSKASSPEAVGQEPSEEPPVRAPEDTVQSSADSGLDASGRPPSEPSPSDCVTGSTTPSFADRIPTPPPDPSEAEAEGEERAEDGASSEPSQS